MLLLSNINRQRVCVKAKDKEREREQKFISFKLTFTNCYETAAVKAVATLEIFNAEVLYVTYAKIATRTFQIHIKHQASKNKK